MNWRAAKLAALLGLLAIGVAGAVLMRGGSQDGDATATVALRPDDAATVARGRGVYLEHCAACHGQKLEGQPDWQRRRPDGKLPAPPHDETGHTWHHPDAVLFALTKLGPARVVGDPAYATDMPGYDGVLDDDAIIAVLSYIKSTWPAAIRARHDRLNETARRD